MRPNFMRQIIQLIFVLSFGFPPYAHAETPLPASTPVFAMRAVVDKATAKVQPEKYEKMKLVEAGTESEIYVDREILLSDEMLQSAELDRQPGLSDEDVAQIKKHIAKPISDGSLSELQHPPDGIRLTFSVKGKSRLAEVTRANIGRRLAIVLNGNVATAPTVREEILWGQLKISGAYSPEELNEMAKQLNIAAGHIAQKQK